MKSHVFKFRFEIKVNLAPYFFVQIDQIQSKTPFTVNKNYNLNYFTFFQQFTFGFINFYLGWMTPTPEMGLFK